MWDKVKERRKEIDEKRECNDNHPPPQPSLSEREREREKLGRGGGGEREGGKCQGNA